MMKEAIFHLPQGAYAYAVSKNEARITLRAKKGDLMGCILVYEDRFEAPGSYGTVEMEDAGSDGMFDYYQTTISSETKRIRYRFLLDDGKTTTWFAEGGFAVTGEKAGWFHLPYLNAADLFEVPEWVNDAVVYQIFPDRFRNGNPARDPEGVLSWDEGQRPTPSTFFGGDLEGVIEGLPYLEELGVNLIYMTPIFLSPSTHKYDTIDYLQIDPMFGDLETCKRLVDEAHKRGMRVMLDAVFNHCGAQFPPFQDVVEKGADSEFADWFHIHLFPVDMDKVNYETFAVDVWAMPKFKTENPAVRDYLLNVAEFWVKEIGIDGWRLDVADEIDHSFWRDFRRVVKAANKDALIVGEAWHESGEWLQGDQWDSVMNYLFRDACLDFFAKNEIDAERFDGRLTRKRMLYREQANRAMFNLLGSHDTARFLTECGENKDRMKLAVVFQMTYIGIPEIYYGDEVGMVGKTDPDCRRTMIWDVAEQDRQLFDLHKRLIAIRKEFPALQTGRFQTIVSDALTNVYGYIRQNEQETIYVLLNNSSRPQPARVPMMMQGTDLLEDGVYEGDFEMEPYGALVLRMEEIQYEEDEY
jgi:cyclomaltodextrinase / maltogenic alpha-amylase / neopullulanase